MKTYLVAIVFLLVPQVGIADVSPITNGYGNVFPVLTEQSLDVFRQGSGPEPQYVSFNLVLPANVRVGVLGLGASNNGTSYDLTSMRLVSIAGNHVKSGTDTFADNPFSNPIESLAVADNLSPGLYAIEVSGSGNRSSVRCTIACATRDVSDFTTRIQVLEVSAVPEPETYALMLAGLGLIGYAASCRKRG